MAKLIPLVFWFFFCLSSYSAKKCIDIPDAIKEQRYIEFDSYYRKLSNEASKKRCKLING